MKPHHLSALRFVSAHPGTRSPAFPWGFAYRFEAPGVKRVPFRLLTLQQLIAMGLVGVDEGNHVTVTTTGRAALETAS